MKYKIALISAYIGTPGNSELTITPACQKEFDEYGVDIYKYTDKDLNLLASIYKPIKKKEEIYKESIKDKLYYLYKYLTTNWQIKYPTPEANFNRLIAKLPRMQFYKLIEPCYDYYIWCDSKFTLDNGWLNYILELIGKNEDKDLLSYAHSERTSIRQEFDYMRYHMKKKRRPVKKLLARYNIAKMYRQICFYLKDKNFEDNRLFETGVMVYSNKMLQKKEFLDDWYTHNYYFSIQDQLSFPYLISKHNINVGTINQSIFDTGFTSYKYH